MLHVLSETNSIASVFISELRDINIQKDSLRFRKNLERLGEIFAFEISKKLNYSSHEVTTPLGIATVFKHTDRMVLATILRAGLPLHQGLLNYFDNADNAFISSFRKHHKDGSFDIRLDYVTCPDLSDCVLIVADSMLATGRSIVSTLKELTKYGVPKTVHIVTAIAAREGIEHIERMLPNANIWVGALDEELTAKSYIVPGLGDAGDLSYGIKLQS
ncbi:MAG TPA: uracil phosphoribosyltransferase, partial [Saprospiraceae bacterium]|nr:uracil phosphoribosyltransferase [Saprospiraceae bacterium]